MHSIENIPITNICLDFRDDIFFRTFVLEENRWDAWQIFANLRANTKIKRKCMKHLNMYNSIRKKGQIKPVPVFVDKNKIYPLNGATRISCILALGIKDIKVIKYFDVIPKTYQKHFQKTRYKITGRMFEGMPIDLLSEFQIWMAKRKNYYEIRNV